MPRAEPEVIIADRVRLRWAFVHLSAPCMQCSALMCVCPAQRVVIYPAYIDSNLTVAGGRRVPQDKGALH